MSLYTETLKQLHAGENISQNTLLCRWRDERNQLLKTQEMLWESLETLTRAFKKIVEKYVPNDVKPKSSDEL